MNTVRCISTVPPTVKKLGRVDIDNSGDSNDRFDTKLNTS